MSTTGQTLRVACIAEIPIGREMAHAINAFKTAGGFRRLGLDVIQYCLAPTTGTVESALAAYGEQGMQVELISPAGKADSDEYARDFARQAVERAASDGCTFIYGRNFHAGLYGPRANLRTVIETHAHVDDPRPLLDEVFAQTRHADHPLCGIVTIAPVLREHYITRGADPRRVHLVADAADPDLFARPSDPGPDPITGRRPRAVYCGHLYDYKGIPTMLAAARLAPEIEWVFVGGTRADIERVRAQAGGLANVRVHGRVPHAAVPPMLWHADVLVLPPDSDHPSAAWTSPVKLAEYLWADRPVVASDIPGLRNWLDAPAVTWFKAGDAASLAQAVRNAVQRGDDEAAAAARSVAASLFTYQRRAERILGAGGLAAMGNRPCAESRPISQFACEASSRSRV